MQSHTTMRIIRRILFGKALIFKIPSYHQKCLLRLMIRLGRGFGSHDLGFCSIIADSLFRKYEQL